jgi:hypothetical protein
MTPKINVYYQHRYGGLYKVQDIALSTVDNSKWVVYAHTFPFQYEVWTRPYDEWCDGRFREITNQEYSEFLKRDKVEFQLEIGKNRAKQ